jgi:hypothetical protein
MFTIEIFASILTIIAAFLMSNSTNTSLFWAFVLFSFSNVLYFIVSFEHNTFFLLIQVMIFSIVNYIGLIERYPLRTSKSLFFSSIFLSQIFILALGLIAFDFSFPSSFHVDFIELSASVLAVSGSFYLARSDNFKEFGFFAFFIADVLYIFVALQNDMIPFAIQSAFFIYTSSRGIINSRNERLSNLS